MQAADFSLHFEAWQVDFRLEEGLLGDTGHCLAFRHGFEMTLSLGFIDSPRQKAGINVLCREAQNEEIIRCERMGGWRKPFDQSRRTPAPARHEEDIALAEDVRRGISYGGDA